MNTQPYQEIIHIDGNDIKFKIEHNNTKTSSISIKNGFFLITISTLLQGVQFEKQLMEFKKWAIKQLKKKPNLLTVLASVQYQHEDTITLAGNVFTLNIYPTCGAVSQGKIDKERKLFNLFLPVNLSEEKRLENARYLVVTLAKRLCLPSMTKRVHYFNDLYFKKPIAKINIRDKTTSWGSCSNSGSLNMSVNLLKAPVAVIDYVIVHELAHLIEFNHSDRFWAIVANVLPNYLEFEKDLDDNGFLYRF